MNTNTDTNVESNENWSTCPKCGSPVLMNPETGRAEPCASCASQSSKQAGAIGLVMLLAGIAAIIGLVYLCVRILL